MSRRKILSGPIQLGATSLDDIDLSNEAFEDSQSKRSRSELQRWRKLKHQLA